MLTTTSGGPLAWVHPEIEVALIEVARALETANWNDAASRIVVLAHLHQVSGALRMVELPGPQRLAEELETLLGSLQSHPPVEVVEACQAAIRALRTDLDERLVGHGARDLDLLPALQRLGSVRGLEHGACELFHPDLSAFPPGQRTPPDPATAAEARRLRADFQRGLLAVLRAPQPAGHTAPLAGTLDQVARRAPGMFGAARWSLLSTVLMSVPPTAAAPAAVADLRRLCTRTDQQLRRNAAADDQPNDALLREALYLGSTIAAPGRALQGALSAARVPELLAPAAPAGPVPQIANPAFATLAQVLARAEETLEVWFRSQGSDPLPPILDRDLAEAARQLDALGDDVALMLLDGARQALKAFPPPAELSEARLEPVAETLAGLLQYADGVSHGDTQAAARLAALRDRLREQPGAETPTPQRATPAMPDLVAHGIDESLFSVFIEEADELLRTLQEHAAALHSSAPPFGTVEQARATLQTLRGSGLVAGLLPLAQLCGELDHTLAAWMPRGELPWHAPGQLLADSTRELERWLARLATDRQLALPAVPLINRARELRAQPALSLAPLISLQDIFLEEAGDRLHDLREAMGQDPLRVHRLGDALRAVHTLAGIARTAEHPGMADLARAMETVYEVLRGNAGVSPASRPVIERLHAAIGVLDSMRGSLVAGRALQPADELVRVLRRDADLLHEQALQDVGVATRQNATVLPALDTEAIDSADAELLPVFLEECAELLPALDAALRAWSEGAGPEQGARALKRGLHTLKGSARMCGLLRQGAIAHRLEDLVLRWSDSDAVAGPEAFEEIQAGLDDLALGIERLTHPDAASAAPAVYSAPVAFGSQPPAEPAAPVPSVAAAEPVAPIADEAAAEPVGPVANQAAAESVVPVANQAAAEAVAPAVAPAAADPVAPVVVAAAADPVAPMAIEAAAEPAAPVVVAAATEPVAPVVVAAAAEPVAPMAIEAAAKPVAPVVVEAAAEPVVPVAPAAAEAAAPPATPAAPAAVEAAALPLAAEPVTAPPVQGEAVSPLLRIRVEALDRMANAAGEAGIGRARLETEAGSIKRSLGDLAENIQRLKGQLREIEIHAERALPATLPEAASRHGFDPLELDRYSRLQELARSLAEGIDDVHTVHQALRRGVDEVELALRQQGRVIRDLQQDLLRARMVPFSSLAERLQRTTRQAARESGRELGFQLVGGQNEVDRSILERLAAPLEHLLRNAAVHAIEPPDVRRDLGKAAQGQLTIHLTPGEHEVQVRVSDDGRGIDLARVRAQAEASGLLRPDQACPDEELLQLIFRPGFSTARSVTSLAGRGVGLDVVRSEVIGLGGRIHLDTRPGAGTDFTLVIPVTLATVQAVVVRAGDGWFAIPAPLVEHVRPVARDALAELYRERSATLQGLRYPFTSLNRVLGLGAAEAEPQGTQQLLYLRSGDRRCALRIDELAGAQEIVVKSVSPHLARIPGVSGASVLGNGRIVLILNPVPLAVGADGMIPEALLPAEPAPQVPTVMVVDDSITVRRVTTRLLERTGYQVRLAKDGQDALEQLADTLPDAMLLDVEMPRMDGFELVARLRANERTRGLPVIMITSRTAERHRNHAQSLGVQGYLGKPYRDEDLVGLLAQVLQASCPQPAATGHPVVLSLVR